MNCLGQRLINSTPEIILKLFKKHFTTKHLAFQIMEIKTRDDLAALPFHAKSVNTVQNGWENPKTILKNCE